MHLRTLYTAWAVAFLVFPTLSAQTDRLTGRVVEIVDKEPRGIPEVRVAIPDFHYRHTDDQGYFELSIPERSQQVTVILEDSPYRLISPYDGIVVLPPEGELLLVVCGAENRRLQQRVDALNARVRAIEQKRRLTQRQLVKLQQQLVDTVLHYESRLREADAVIESYEHRADQQDRRIARLEDSIQVLVQQLAVALEARYLRQREVFARLSAQMHQYIDRAKDLQDEMSPHRLPAYFRHQGAQVEFKKTVEAYNAARLALIEGREQFLKDVDHYWQAPALTAQCARTFDLALDNLHREHIYPLNTSINDQLKAFSYQEIGRVRAEKSVTQSAERELPGINARIDELGQLAERTLTELANRM